MIETLMDKGLTRQQALAFEWQFGHCGGFKGALWKCLTLADDKNLMRLRLAFPEEVDALISYRIRDGWWEHVLTKARELGLIEEGVS